MVGKLLKHDFIALGRILLPTGIVVLVFALLYCLLYTSDAADEL